MSSTHPSISGKPEADPEGESSPQKVWNQFGALWRAVLGPEETAFFPFGDKEQRALRHTLRQSEHWCSTCSGYFELSERPRPFPIGSVAASEFDRVRSQDLWTAHFAADLVIAYIKQQGLAAASNNELDGSNPYPEELPAYTIWREAWMPVTRARCLQEGATAADVGRHERDNPYLRQTTAHEAWIDGWKGFHEMQGAVSFRDDSLPARGNPYPKKSEARTCWNRGWECARQEALEVAAHGWGFVTIKDLEGPLSFCEYEMTREAYAVHPEHCDRQVWIEAMNSDSCPFPAGSLAEDTYSFGRAILELGAQMFSDIAATTEESHVDLPFGDRDPFPGRSIESKLFQIGWKVGAMRAAETLRAHAVEAARLGLGQEANPFDASDPRWAAWNSEWEAWEEMRKGPDLLDFCANDDFNWSSLNLSESKNGNPSETGSASCTELSTARPLEAPQTEQQGEFLATSFSTWRAKHLSEVRAKYDAARTEAAKGRE